jgi:hypothetical protein
VDRSFLRSRTDRGLPGVGRGRYIYERGRGIARRGHSSVRGLPNRRCEAIEVENVAHQYARGILMSNDTWSLADISAAILSYNSAHIAESQRRTIKDEIVVGKPTPPSIIPGRMRRHDDQDGPGRWPIR